MALRSATSTMMMLVGIDQCTEAGDDVFLPPGIEDRLLDEHVKVIYIRKK